MEIGERIRDARTTKGLSLRGLSAELGISPSTLQRYENGIITGIPPKMLNRIADLLGTSASWLMGEDEAVKPQKQTCAVELTESEQFIIHWYRKCSDSERKAIRSILLSFDQARDNEYELQQRLSFAEEFIEDRGDRAEYENLVDERFSTDS